jgi:hypothetical protein
MVIGAGRTRGVACSTPTGRATRAVMRVVVVLGIVAAALGGAGSDEAGAKGDDNAQLHSPTFGLTITWGDQWRAIKVSQDGGVVAVSLDGEQGDVTLWAGPAFGGDGPLCIDEVERRLEADPGVANLERSGPPPPLALPTAASELWQMDYQPEGETSAIPWSHAAWCVTLQPGYSVLQFEVTTEASLFQQAVDAAADIVVSTTTDLPAPEFEYAADRDDLTSFWSQQFAARALDPYIAPTYVSFASPVSTGCGPVGPLDEGFFYCTADNVVYVDRAMADDLSTRYGVGVERFLMAHETGHHVAWLVGYTSPCTLSNCLTEINDVQWELMADCFAGAWMANASERGVLSTHDVEDVLVGVADTFSDSSHGSSALRLWWLLQGFHDGVAACFEPEAS